MTWLIHILDIIFPPRATELIVRNIHTLDFVSLVEPVEILYGSVGIVSLLRYENPAVSSCVLEAKFHNNKKAQELLGFALASYLPELVGEAFSYGRQTIIVPVPLSKHRKKSRGYNQVFEIASRAVKGDGPGCISLQILTRKRDTVPQTSLSGRERRENMHGAFQVGEIDERRAYLVIDDVSTTGATLLSAHGALKDAGANHIALLSLAH